MKRIVCLIIMSIGCSEPAQDTKASADQQLRAERVYSFIGVQVPPWLIASPGACPGPGAAPAQGYGVGMFPCSRTMECEPGLTCNYAVDLSDPSVLPFGAGASCGLCQSDLAHCPPVAAWWASCGAPPQSPCPTYISRSVQGSGCTWNEDCISGGCDYTQPVQGFCGRCN